MRIHRENLWREPTERTHEENSRREATVLRKYSARQLSKRLCDRLNSIAQNRQIYPRITKFNPTFVITNVIKNFFRINQQPMRLIALVFFFTEIGSFKTRRRVNNKHSPTLILRLINFSLLTATNEESNCWSKRIPKSSKNELIRTPESRLRFIRTAELVSICLYTPLLYWAQYYWAFPVHWFPWSPSDSP